MSAFPHLHFVKKVTGSYRGTSETIISERTKGNRGDLATHGSTLKTKIDTIRQNWEAHIEGAVNIDYPEGLTKSVPLFLEVDPECFNVASLSAWGIEVVAEEENGFIIATTTESDISKLYDRLQKIIGGETNNLMSMASLWDIHDRPRSLESVVSESLLNRWETLDDEAECWIDVSINVGLHMPGECPDDASTRTRNKWQKSCENYEIQSDERQEQLLTIITQNGGTQESGFSSLGDSSTCRVKIPGLGVKNIFFDHPYVWEITECDIASELKTVEDGKFIEYNPEIISPAPDAPRVCVIDSGMQTGHRLLEPAVDSSVSYVLGDTSVADYVANGGHGTRVGGAVLYPNEVPRSGIHQPVAWLQNARILDEEGRLHKKLFPPLLMRTIVEDHLPTRIYNMSVYTPIPCPKTHMSAWAAELDQLSAENDVLFILCAGNIEKDVKLPTRLGLLQHLAAGRQYPFYLGMDSCRIGNPAQSCQAITVGSVCFDKVEDDDYSSFGNKDMPSAFSRSGLGMWSMIKPDVVEYGGDSVLTSINTFIEKEGSCPELLASTLTSAKAVSRNVVGTSFAAPKVAHIAAVLQSVFPDSRTLLYRALIAQSARWPQHAEDDSIENRLFHFRTLGYGIPSLERAIENSDSRVTFIAEGKLAAGNANIYEILIPGIGSPGDETLYRLDVTLSYAARPRRTRRLLRSYVSTRLQWQAAKLGESIESFQSRLKFTLENTSSPEFRPVDVISSEGVPWHIDRRIDTATSGIRVQDNTLQKDWAFIKGYELPEYSLLFAVTAHHGWDKTKHDVPYAIAVTLTSLDGNRIYEQIAIANRIDLDAGEISV